MAETNRQLIMRSRPTGLLDPADYEVVETPIPEIVDGEALVRTNYIGVDAAVRTWLDDRPGYLPPVQVGEVVRAGAVGEVVATKCDAYEVGDIVSNLPGLQQYSISRDDVFTTKLPKDVNQHHALSVLGSTGATAYFGLLDIGQPKEGETVLISAAAGATGSIAGQIAKIMGCRVVGLAGTDEKCRVVVDEFGFDACINYKTADLKNALKEHCPKRVDIYFDSVGGRVLDAALGGLAMNGRVVLCGAISTYTENAHYGPSNYTKLMAMRGRMEGFNTLDKWDRYDEAFGALKGWIDDGRLVVREQVYEGIASGVEAINAMFTGGNIGKIIIAVE